MWVHSNRPMAIGLAVACFGTREGASSAAHVYTFADSFQDPLCFLASTVQAAGGVLHVLGLRDGGPEFPLPWGDLDPVRGDEPWHFGDRSVMLKKHIFLSRAIRGLQPNETVIFVDGFDVLFQRPLADMVMAYRELASTGARETGHWPVIFGGERNCWPFPHDQKLVVRTPADSNRLSHRVHRIPDYSFLSTNHNAERLYPYGDDNPWNVRGDAFCSEWLSQQTKVKYAQSETLEHGQDEFPFLCAGTFMGTVSALKRLYARLFALYKETREYHDQALLALALLRNRSLGFVDASAKLFLSLHGHEELSDLDRRLCYDGYFLRDETINDVWRKQGGPEKMQPGQAPLVHDFSGHLPSPLRRGSVAGTPFLLHFNGNAKQHYPRCVDQFHNLGFISGKAKKAFQCIYFDGDLKDWAIGR